jgi:hypothetical protein
LPDAAPGRFTSAVFVAEECWMPVSMPPRQVWRPCFTCGALITSSVDCAGQGMTGPVRQGPPCPLPDRTRQQACRASWAYTEAEVIKSRGTKGKARVTFTIDPQVGAQAAAVCGEWNGWSADAGVMRRDAEGGFSVTVDLDVGRAYRFRYLLDGRRWDNDWAADAYVRNDFGGDDSVVDLTALAEAVPSATRRTSAKKATSAESAKKATSAAKRGGRAAK